MDIVTHAVIGAIVASPFLDSHPLPAVCFALGSVLPDLDALSRIFGKRAFMSIHQTYSHALPVIALVGFAAWPLLDAFGAPPLAALTLALGMVVHSLLDVSNTYGIALFLPFSRRRFSAEWVFFIDGVVVALSYPTLIILNQTNLSKMLVLVIYSVAMALYWICKAVLRRRAFGLSPKGTVSLLPSALVPWHFLGCCQEGETVLLFQINALNGVKSEEERVALFDADFEAIKAEREYQIMCSLSPAYHIVESKSNGNGTRLLCRDLRTRNFKTKFGELEVQLDTQGFVKETVFHV